MAYKIYQILLTHLNYTLCKKLPLAQFSKTIKDGLNPTEKNLTCIKLIIHILCTKDFFFSPACLKKSGAITGK